MKRVVILLFCAIAFFGLSAALFAEESVLINFSDLVADYSPAGSDSATENEATLIDFGDKAGTGFTEDEKKLMKTSLALENWEVFLASSSRTVFNQQRSLTRQVTVKDEAKRFAGEIVLGIRVHFPIEHYNAWALVRPPFEIPMYMQKTVVQDDGTLVPDADDSAGSKFNNIGVVKNVGVIKSISLNILGLNFPMGCEIVLKDQNNEEKAMFMSYLNFDGWRTLTWTNPNYISEVKNREIKRYPLYPTATPAVKLVGLRFFRDKVQDGGDFITYVKDISIVYDKAVLTLDTDVNNEGVWGILSEREESRRNAEFAKLGEIQILRHLEKQKMHQEEE
jgi:hypothetical protein